MWRSIRRQKTKPCRLETLGNSAASQLRGTSGTDHNAISEAIGYANEGMVSRSDCIGQC